MVPSREKWNRKPQTRRRKRRSRGRGGAAAGSNFSFYVAYNAQIFEGATPPGRLEVKGELQ
jgi:hypothetical protein